MQNCLHKDNIYLIDIMSSTHTVISSFTSVSIIPNSLVLVNIDDTFLTYPQIGPDWWKSTYDKYYNYVEGAELSCSAEEFANTMTWSDWKDIVMSSLPVHTDCDGFFDMFQRAKDANSKIVFLTDRSHYLMGSLKEHLCHLGIYDTSREPYVGIAVWFTRDYKLTDKIEEIQKDDPDRVYEHIVFVDNKSQNVSDVKNHFGDNVDCYKFEMDLLSTSEN